MSLDVYLEETIPTNVYSANVTHNLRKMADAAGLYDIVWRPDEHGITTASQLIEPLRAGIERLKADPEHYQQFNPNNGWGSYNHFIVWLEQYLTACEEHPNAFVTVSR